MRIKPATHKRSVRLINNAGMSYPVCRSGSAMLCLDASLWKMSVINERVTCRNCLKVIKKNPFA